MKWFSFLRNYERRTGHSEIEGAVNRVLTAQAVGDLSSKPHISEEGALNLSAVWACVRILSDTVGILPLHVYKRTERGREKQYSHPCHTLMQFPNSYSNRMDLTSHLMVSMALWGNAYVRIYRDHFHRPVRLQFLHPMRVEPILETQTDTLYYRIDGGRVISNDEVIHIKNLSTNGYMGKSPIAVHRDNLSLTMAAQLYGEKFFNQGGNMSGVFKYPSTLKPDAYERLRRDLTAQTVGLHNAHIPLLLEGGMQYERISIPPEDAQFIATRKFQKTEIATIFGVPPHMIADLDRATNNNIEHQGMEFVTYCLMPYIVKIEQEFNRKLLRDDEHATHYFKFNTNGLLRGDAKNRSEYYKNLYYIGAMSSNEARENEEMNSYEGGDEYFVPMNMQTVKNALKPNTNETKRDGGQMLIDRATGKSRTGAHNNRLRRQIRKLERTYNGMVGFAFFLLASAI